MRPPLESGGYIVASTVPSGVSLASMRPPLESGGYFFCYRGAFPIDICFNEAAARKRRIPVRDGERVQNENMLQ